MVITTHKADMDMVTLNLTATAMDLVAMDTVVMVIRTTPMALTKPNTTLEAWVPWARTLAQTTRSTLETSTHRSLTQC
jgi:hypothetical protein